MKAVIHNVVTIICFTALSVYFGQWWIVLFSAIFVEDIKEKKDKTENDVSTIIA